MRPNTVNTPRSYTKEGTRNWWWSKKNFFSPI